MDSKTLEVSPMAPPDTSFLAGLKPSDVDGQLDTVPAKDIEKKKRLLGVLRFYFGLVQWWNVVATTKALGPLRFFFRADLIPADFFHNHPAQKVKLYAKELKNEEPEQPSYFSTRPTTTSCFTLGQVFRLATRNQPSSTP